MFRCIYTLKKELEGKDLYVWGCGKWAVWTFAALAYKGLNCAGFISPDERYEGGQFMNRPVLSRKALSELQNALVLFDRNIEPDVLNDVRRDADCLYLKDALSLNEALHSEESFYIYGAGYSAWLFLKILSSAGLKPKGFLLTDRGSQQSILGLPVWSFSEAPLNEKDAIFVSVQHYIQKNQILDTIACSSFRGNVYADESSSYWESWGSDPFSMLDLAVKTNKKVLLCCEDAMTRDLLHRTLALYGIPVAGQVCLHGDPSLDLPDIYELADEDPRQCVLLAHSFSAEQRYRIMDAAHALGFSAEKLNFATLILSNYNLRKASRQLDYEEDALMPMNASLDYTPFGGKPGWAVYGDEEKAQFRIMTLGGSTSSEVYYPENWVSKLSRKLASAGVRAVIYNGAVEMADVHEELIRMCRDIHFLKPDLVISMSGVNDMKKGHGKFNAFRGESSFAYWRRFESYASAVARAEGAAYEAFLQPINSCMPDPGLEESLFFLQDVKVPCSAFLRESSNDDFYHNLLSLFFHEEGMFIDFCHYSEAGHEVLAETVFQTIRKYFE